MPFPEQCFIKVQTALLTIALIALTITSVQAESDEKTNRIVKLSGKAFVTNDLDVSIDFYSRFLGFEVVRRFELTAPASKSIYGITGDERIEYAALIPAGWPLDTPNLSGLNFAQIEGAENSLVTEDKKRNPFYGEFILTYEVRELAEIEREMKSAGVPIVTPLAPSGTGKSMTLTVLDPNGLRVHFYEYIDKQ